MYRIMNNVSDVSDNRDDRQAKGVAFIGYSHILAGV